MRAHFALPAGFLLGCLVFVAARALVGLSGAPRSSEYSSLEGQRLPTEVVDFVSQAGVDAELHGALWGLLVVMDGCRACEVVYPLAREQPLNFPLIGVAVGTTDEYDRVCQHLAGVPVLWDPDKVVLTALGGSGYPTLFTVDEHGTIAEGATGTKSVAAALRRIR